MEEAPCHGDEHENNDVPEPRHGLAPIDLWQWQVGGTAPGGRGRGGALVEGILVLGHALALEARQFLNDQGVREVQTVFFGILNHLGCRASPIQFRRRGLVLGFYRSLGRLDLFVELFGLVLLPVAHIEVSQQLRILATLLEGVVVTDIVNPLLDLPHFQLALAWRRRVLHPLVVDLPSLEHASERFRILIALHLALPAQPFQQLLHHVVLWIR
mmetsp:Transcript_22398/g.62930  ORF Transcript_22398/g.62930 Transcript_22398/m.62930 type:complete len:214 (+) Transcript_22398:254-895(+)